MATSIVAPSLSNLPVNTDYRLQFCAGCRLRAPCGLWWRSITATSSSAQPRHGRCGRHRLWRPVQRLASSIAEGTLTQVNNAQSLQAYNSDANASTTLKISAVLGAAYNRTMGTITNTSTTQQRLNGQDADRRRSRRSAYRCECLPSRRRCRRCNRSNGRNPAFLPRIL